MECRHHPTCPGCPLLETPYELQLAVKRDRLARALGRYPHLKLNPPQTCAPAAFTEGYRHRLKLPVHVGRDHVAIGLYHPENGRILDTPDCPVLEPGLRKALQPILAWMAGRNGIHAVDLRRSSATGELQVVFACLGGDLHGGPKAARQLIAAVPGLTSVAVSHADPERKRVMGNRPSVIAGAPHIEEAIGDTRYRLFPGAFFQVDPRNAAWIHEKVKTFVDGSKRVLDLYSGVGAYALMLAPGREQVVAVEEVGEAVRAARAMAPPNVQVIESRVEDARLEGRFDAVILNPARRGSDPASLARIAKLAPKLIYVSCGPETLARDLDCLATHGMRVTGMDAVDLFPQTPEIETVVRLERGRPLEDFEVPGGRASGPWDRDWSGALGRPSRVLALVLGDAGTHGKLPGARWKRLGIVATHSLVRIELEGPLVPVLAAFARDGHAVAGRERKTARFFAEKVGLVRPFVHVERAGQAVAPLHGDLVEALVGLGADDLTIRRATGASA
jgi:23S rRNA (uracil1939-C5)-methyltransferase